MNSERTWMTQNATLSRVPLKTSHWAVELVEKHHTTSLRMTQNMLQNLMLPLIFPEKHLPYGRLHLSPGICFGFPGLFLSHLRRHGSGLFAGVDDDRRDESKTTAGPGRNGWARTPKTTLTFNVPKGATKLKKNIDMKWDMLGECTHCGDTWRGKALASHMDFLPLGIFTYTSKHQDFGFVVGELTLHYILTKRVYIVIHIYIYTFWFKPFPTGSTYPNQKCPQLQQKVLLPLLTSIDVVSSQQRSASQLLLIIAGYTCALCKWSHLTDHFWKGSRMQSIGQLMETWIYH